MEHLWDVADRGEQKYLEKEDSQCQFVHYRSNIDRPGSNLSRCCEKPVT
jgi:hypothetical protein